MAENLNPLMSEDVIDRGRNAMPSAAKPATEFVEHGQIGDRAAGAYRPWNNIFLTTSPGSVLTARSALSGSFLGKWRR
jgi:hypothetical protein